MIQDQMQLSLLTLPIDIKPWLTLTQPSSLSLFRLREGLEFEHPIIIRWLTSTKGLNVDEDKLFAILNSNINALNFSSFKKLNLLRIIARCLENLGKSYLISNFFLQKCPDISKFFSLEQQIKMFTEFDNNSKAMLSTESYSDELFYAVAEYIYSERIEFKTKAIQLIESGFSEHLTTFFTNWDRGIVKVCTKFQIECWLLDEQFPGNLITLLGDRSHNMHIVAKSLCDYHLRDYIVKFWRHNYNDFNQLQNLDLSEVEQLIVTVSESELDSDALRFYLDDINK